MTLNELKIKRNKILKTEDEDKIIEINKEYREALQNEIKNLKPGTIKDVELNEHEKRSLLTTIVPVQGLSDLTLETISAIVEEWIEQYGKDAFFTIETSIGSCCYEDEEKYIDVRSIITYCADKNKEQKILEKKKLELQKYEEEKYKNKLKSLKLELAKML